MGERPLPRDWKDRPSRTSLIQQIQEHPLTVKPKGFRHPELLRAEREIHQIEDALGLGRCCSCGEHVIEGRNPGAQMHRVCGSCFSSIPPQDAA